MCHGPYASFFLLVAGGLGGKRRADLGRFLGVHDGELRLHLGSLERGLRSSLIALSVGAGSRGGLGGSSARSIAGTRGALPRSSSGSGLLGGGPARLGLGGGADLHGLLTRSFHLGCDHTHGLGSRDLVEKALKVNLHVGNGKTKQVVGLIFKRKYRRIVRADGRNLLVPVDALDYQVLDRIAAILRNMLLSSTNVDKRIDQAIRPVVHTALGMHLHKARAGTLERLHMRQELVDPDGGIDCLLHYSASFAAVGAADVPAGASSAAAVSPAPAAATNPSSPSSTPSSQVAAPPTVSGSAPARITASF